MTVTVKSDQPFIFGKHGEKYLKVKEAKGKMHAVAKNVSKMHQTDVSLEKIHVKVLIGLLMPLQSVSL